MKHIVYVYFTDKIALSSPVEMILSTQFPHIFIMLITVSSDLIQSNDSFDYVLSEVNAK